MARMVPWLGSLRNDIAQSSMLRMSECSVLVDALLLGGGAAVVCEQFLGVHRPLSVAPHELAEQYRARGDALDLDDAVVAAAAASR